MQQHNRPELEALTYGNLPNNTTGYIDPAKLREVLLALIASLLNLLDDGNPGAGGGGTTPVRATFGNLGGKPEDNALLLAYLAGLGHPLTEYLPPMTVKSGYWYITSTGIWAAKSNFNGAANPMPGSYWRLVAGFGGTGTPQQAVLTALAATSFDVEVAVAHPTDTGRYRLRAFPKTTGGDGTPYPPPAPSGFTVDSDRQAAFTPDAGTVASDYEYQLEE